jgi:hypothetical protein
LAFLRIGPGAAAWLVEAATAGTRKVKAKMAEAVALSKLYPGDEVDRALGTAAVTGRFAEKDLFSILDYQAGAGGAEATRAGEDHSLQPGTSAWANFGTTAIPENNTDTGTESNEEMATPLRAAATAKRVRQSRPWKS